MSAEKYIFLVEWFDPTAKEKRRFLFSFYPSDKSVDMYDIVCKRVFLRRMQCQTVEESDLFLGSVVNVLSRQLCIVAFGDKKTEERFSHDLESTIIIINESGFSRLGQIIAVLEDNELFLNKGKMMDKDKNEFHSSSLSEHLKNKFVVIELRGEDAKRMVKKLLSSDSSGRKALKSNFGNLREHCLSPDDTYLTEQEIRVFFPPTREVHCNTALFINSTCCIIKPHAVREKKVGLILQDITEAGFAISAFEVIIFNINTASEFLEVYKGVVSEFKEMVDQMVAGPCIALEITKNSGQVFTEFRTFVGPSDPDIAQQIRPGTLRATYGKDKIKNAVHCTDLSEDALIELDYVFRVLSA